MADNVTVTVIGGEECAAKFYKLSAEQEVKVVQQIVKSSLKIETDAKRRAPSDLGFLRSGIVTRIMQKGFEAGHGINNIDGKCGSADGKDEYKNKNSFLHHLPHSRLPPPFRRASEPEPVSGPGPAGRGTRVLGPGGLRPPAIAGELSAGAGLAGLPSQQSRRPADLASPAAAPRTSATW